jgi:hypothetical protein
MIGMIGITLLAATGLAAADPYSLGIRVGGYGFKREGDSSSNAWTRCQMQGFGLFANHTLRGPLFHEAGLDGYTSTNTPQPMDLPIDRQSAIVSGAIGARATFGRWFDIFGQAGVGMELTRVAVPYGDSTLRDDKVLPAGFFGFGAELNYRGTHAGAMVRTLVMGNFNYDPMRLEQNQNAWVSQPDTHEVFAASPAMAAQGQFYIRHDL